MPLGKLGSRGIGLLGALVSDQSSKDAIHPVPPLNTIVNENYSPYSLPAFILLENGDTITTESY